MKTPYRTSLLRIATALTLCSAPALHAADELVAGSITNSPPMISYADDGTTLQGAIVELAAAMSKQMGRTITFKSLPFPGLLPAMQSKQIDMVFTLMSDTPERQKVVDFVDFYNFGTRLLVSKGNPDKIESLDSLCGKTVSTVQGSTQISLVEDTSKKCLAAGKPEVKNMQFSQPSDARLQLQTRRVSAFLGSSPIMSYIAQTAGGGNMFEVVKGQEYQFIPLGIAVAKDNVALRNALQKALTELIAKGVYQKIWEKYGIESGALKTITINGG